MNFKKSISLILSVLMLLSISVIAPAAFETGSYKVAESLTGSSESNSSEFSSSEIATSEADTSEIATSEADTSEVATSEADASEVATSEADTSETATSEASDAGYEVTFVTNAHAKINVYYQQDYTAPSETDVTSTVSRNKDSGLPDSTGEGQLNFTVIPEEGFDVDTVSAEGGYKNLKGSEDTGVVNTYRITKITGAVVVTVTTKSAADSSETATSESDSSETATSETDTSEASTSEAADTGYEVTFVTDGHATINIYYQQDYSAASETDVTSAKSRNKETGLEDSTGEGQVNFTVVLEDGYEIDTVSAEGGYKNLKGYEDTGVLNTYRVTKITSAVVVTVTTKASATSESSTSESTTSETSTSEQGTSEQGTSESTSSEVAPTEKKDISSWSVKGVVNKKYTGKAITQKVTVTDGSEVATVAVSYSNNKNVGTATIVIKGTGDYTGTIKKTFKITKAANTMTAKAKSKTVKLSKVNKKTQKVTAVTVKKAKGKVTFAKKSGNKKITVNKKTGKITVKKGIKKGKYSVKVKVTANGNSSYKKLSKLVKFTITVK